MNKLVVCIMGQDCKDFLEPCLESVKEADAIVFCDGGSKEEFLDWLQVEKEFSWSEAKNTEEKYIIQRTFDQNDPGNNGKQRNFYLEFLKQHYPGWWCLCLDADEVVDDFRKLRKFCGEQDPNNNSEYLFSPQMRHFIGDFGHEDATLAEHYVPNRLFKVRDDLQYPEGEHVILQSSTPFKQHKTKDAGVIWHLAYAPLFHVRSRFRKNLKHSNAHSPEFLQRWYLSHVFGSYPVSPVRPEELPGCLLKAFNIEPDGIYFRDRGLEVKHFIDAAYWKDHFKLGDGRGTAVEWGCGTGPRVAALRLLGVETHGIEISEWAVRNAMTEDIRMGDITQLYVPHGLHRLAIAYDLLEHVPYEKLDVAIDNLKVSTSKYLLVSVPTLGDPNLDADRTHIIKESKEWWRAKFLLKGLKELEVPAHFPYREQLFIFEVA